MYKVAFEKEAEKEFLKLEKRAQQLIAAKILDLQNGHFENDKTLQGKHKGKFRKHAGNYRIIYLKENNLLLISVIRIAHRKEVY
ncbi:MAG: type II toxin-antitoxin system RelE/ParE family toxin [Sulfurimonas sp.]